MKLCRFVKPEPSVLMANTVPEPELPPPLAVPYKVSPNKINPPSGLAPSVLVALEPEADVKVCSTVKVCAVAQLAEIKPRPAISADRRKRLSLTFTASEQKTACRSPGDAVYVYQKCYGASTRPLEGEAATSSN